MINFKNHLGVFGLIVFCFHLGFDCWISENIFSKNKNRKQPGNENNKFSLFLNENRNLILGRMKLR